MAATSANKFSEELQELLERFSKPPYRMSYREVVGSLEIAKMSLIRTCLDSDDDEPEPGDEWKGGS